MEYDIEFPLPTGQTHFWEIKSILRERWKGGRHGQQTEFDFQSIPVFLSGFNYDHRELTPYWNSIKGWEKLTSSLNCSLCVHCTLQCDHKLSHSWVPVHWKKNKFIFRDKHILRIFHVILYNKRDNEQKRHESTVLVRWWLKHEYELLYPIFYFLLSNWEKIRFLSLLTVQSFRAKNFHQQRSLPLRLDPTEETGSTASGAILTSARVVWWENWALASSLSQVKNIE